MITDEQIKNLKPGDPLIIHGKFESIYDDGDIAIEVNATNVLSDDVIKDTQYVHPSSVSIPPEKPIETFHTTEIPETYPKYDPCRPFRKGDRVETRKLFGRCYSKAAERIMGKICTVLHDEIEHYTVSIRWDGGECSVDPAYLELVTPVEELEPYSIIVQPEDYHCVRIMKGTKIHSSFPFDEEECVYRTLEEAKAAAEAERDRLNAEHRKEQNNG